MLLRTVLAIENECSYEDGLAYKQGQEVNNSRRLFCRAAVSIRGHESDVNSNRLSWSQALACRLAVYLDRVQMVDTE